MVKLEERELLGISEATKIIQKRGEKKKKKFYTSVSYQRRVLPITSNKVLPQKL